jgi:hypothetical protein
MDDEKEKSKMDLDWTKETTFTGMLISKETASAWLERNIANRKLDSRRVAKLANTIRAGQWHVNGQAITFDVSGRLTNGQHRLAAIVASGISCKCDVRTGLHPEAVFTQDTGKVRGLAEQARRHAKVPHSNVVSQWAQTWQRLVSDNPNVSFDVFMLENWYNQHKTAIDWLLKERVKGPFFRAPVCVVLLFSYERNQKKTIDFVSKYKRGSNLEDTDPAYLLREQSIRKAGGGHIYQAVEARRAATALQAHLDGRKIVKIIRSEEALRSLLGENS